MGMRVNGHACVFVPCRLFRRQAASASGIGYTQRLPGDNHLHGLVHWTGYPSEFLFILTRNRASGQVSESWLWRYTHAQLLLDYHHYEFPLLDPLIMATLSAMTLLSGMLIQ